MSNVNLPRLYNRMEAARIDALVVVKPEFFYYATGFQNHMGGLLSGPGCGRQLAAIAVIPAGGKGEPTALVSNWEEVPARGNSWIADIRTYRIWTEIFDLQDLLHNRTERVEKPYQYDMRKNVRTVAELLKEKGLDRGTIGIEFDYVSEHSIAMFREELPHARFADSSPLFYEVSAVKTAKEIEIIGTATRITQNAALDVAGEELLGATVGDVKLKYEMAVLRQIAGNPTLGFQGTKCTMSIGGDFAPKTGSAPYRAAAGDIIFFDPGVMLKGYMTDIGRSMVVGKPNELQQRIYTTLILGLETLLANLKPGVACSELFHIGQEAVRNAGTGLHAYTRGHLGHAVGIGKNERPPFIAPGDHTIVEPGMVFSVELPLYVQGLGGFNIEDTVVVTEQGYELLSDWPRELLQVR